MTRALAILALAACGAPPPPPPVLSATAPDASRERVLLYWYWTSTTERELRWVSESGTDGGRVGNAAGVNTFAEPRETPDGTWLIAHIERDGASNDGAVLVHHAGHEVGFRIVSASLQPRVSPDGTRGLVLCEDYLPHCLVSIEHSQLGPPSPLPGWTQGDILRGWQGARVLVSAGRDLFTIDPATGTRTAAGHVPAPDDIYSADPTGTAVISFLGDNARLTSLAPHGRELRATPIDPLGAFTFCAAPDPASLVCVEIRAKATRYAIVGFSADGRRELSASAETDLAVAAGRIAFYDRTAQELVVTDVRGTGRHALLHAPPGVYMTPVAWVQ